MADSWWESGADDKVDRENLDLAARKLRQRPSTPEGPPGDSEFVRKALADVIEGTSRVIGTGQELHPTLRDLIVRVARHVIDFEGSRFQRESGL